MELERIHLFANFLSENIKEVSVFMSGNTAMVSKETSCYFANSYLQTIDTQFYVKKVGKMKNMATTAFENFSFFAYSASTFERCSHENFLHILKEGNFGIDVFVRIWTRPKQVNMIQVT